MSVNENSSRAIASHCWNEVHHQFARNAYVYWAFMKAGPLELAPTCMNFSRTRPKWSTKVTQANLDLFLTRSALRGIQRRTKDPVRFQRIGTLLTELKTLPTATGDHRKRLDRYIAHQLQLLAA